MYWDQITTLSEELYFFIQIYHTVIYWLFCYMIMRFIAIYIYLLHSSDELIAQ